MLRNFVKFISSKLEETKELQKLRLRPHGVSADALASGRQIVEEESSAVMNKISSLQKFHQILYFSLNFRMTPLKQLLEAWQT